MMLMIIYFTIKRPLSIVDSCGVNIYYVIDLESFCGRVLVEDGIRHQGINEIIDHDCNRRQPTESVV